MTTNTMPTNRRRLLAVAAISATMLAASCSAGSPSLTPAARASLEPLAELPPISGTSYYLSPDGSDSGSGSIDDPWATMHHASEFLEPGDALIARGGRYVDQEGEDWHASGEADAPILFAAYPGETPIFDGDGAGSFLILEDVSYLHVLGLTITGYEPEGTGVLVIIEDSRGITLERLSMYGNSRDQEPGVWTEHLIYPGQGPVRDLTIRECFLDAEGLQGGAVHVYHDPGPIGLTVENNVIQNAHWGVVIDSNAQGVTVRNNEMRGNDHDVAILDSRATGIEVEPSEQRSD